MKRRAFIREAGLASVAVSALPVGSACHMDPPNAMLMLIRYDTEWWGKASEMRGFLEKLVEVHRKDRIPVTLFCKGATLETMESEFRSFHAEVAHDPLFDLQDHSYSHVGIGYANGKPVEVLKADYLRSFEVHEKVFGKRPMGIARCGTSEDGPPLTGFDASEKSREEFTMLVKLGMRMVDTFLTGIDGSRQFINYDLLGYPEVMGFISGFSDTAWMDQKEFGDPLTYIQKEILQRSRLKEHMPVMLHDWVAWQRAPDQELSHVRKIAETGQNAGYRLATHLECYHNRSLWQGTELQDSTP